MHIQDLLSGIRNCACGKEHSCDIRYVEIGDSALERLPEICEPFSHVLLIFDGNTYPLCGKKVEDLLRNKISAHVAFGTEIVVPNEESIAKIEQAIAPNTDLILGIGSGVINDLCKHVSYIHGLRYVIVATAPSMDGYASVGAALILNEMKITLNARVPYAIVAESTVVRTAPMDMIRSGYGDIIGKYSCLNDWKLAHLLRDEYFCPFVWQTVMDTVKRTEGLAKALLARSSDAIQILTEALVMVGIMMSYVQNSRPASGSEHHLSHFFEITGLLHGRDYYLHGIDVLYSAAVTAQLREQLLQLSPPFPTFVDHTPVREADIHRIYTTAAEDILALQSKVGNYDSIDCEKLGMLWKKICDILQEAPSYDTMLDYINAIGLDMNAFQSFYGEQTLCDATRYAKDLKDRYTVLWICYALGVGYQNR